MDLQSYLTLLRSLHIISGVIWAGSLLYLAFFVIVAVKRSGPEGGKFMQTLAATNKLPLVMMILAITSITTGILMIAKLSDGFTSSWFGNRHGIIVSIGGTLGILAFLEGLFVNKPTVDKMNRISKEIAAGGKPPTDAQMQQITRLRNKLFSATRQVAFLLLLTLIAMSLVHYL